MTFLTTSGIFILIFIVNLIREPRSFWNALLFLFILLDSLMWVISVPAIQSKVAGSFVIIIPVLFVATAVFLIINGFVMIRKEGRSLANMLSLITGVVMIAGSIGTILAMYYFQGHIFLTMAVLLVLALEFYFAFAFIALLIYSIMYTLLPKRIKCDYIIVHGCGLMDGNRVSPLLKGRVDKAVRLYNKAKNKPALVVSGGQGSDEKISEAAAMKNYLQEIGFPQDSIIMEDRSTTTFENLQNVRDMLDTDVKKNRYIFVTNNYHVFRTGLFARKLKMKAQGVGCHTKAYYWPSAFIREYIAIMVKYKWIPIVMCIFWAVATVFVFLK